LGPRGRITGSKVEIPPDRLRPGNLYSRAARILAPGEIASLNDDAADLLDPYCLRVAAGWRVPLKAASGPARGPIEGRHRDRLALGAAIAAAAVAATGRGALLDLPEPERPARMGGIKERNDRASACVLAETLHSLAGAVGGAVCEIAIGEGVRRKPGERGGNPTLYAGQVIGDPAAARIPPGERAARGVRVLSVALDAVEGTTRSTIAEGSTGCILYVTEAPIARIPDIYFDRCHLQDVDAAGVNDDLENILQAVRRSRGSPEVNVFSLDRPRHPIGRLADLGASVRTDADGDAFPVVAAGLGFGVFRDNGRPLDGVFGNVGGAAEMIASASAGRYLGVRSTARCAAATIGRWEDRYDFGPGEREAIRASGLDPERLYAIEDLVPGLTVADGLFVAGAITDNAHIPMLDGVLWGGDFASASVLTVGASGAAEVLRLTLSFRQDALAAASALTPFLDRILAGPPDDMRRAIESALSGAGGSRRLRHEFAASFYPHFTEEGGRFRLDMKSVEEAEPEITLRFVRALSEAAPDWFA